MGTRKPDLELGQSSCGEGNVLDTANGGKKLCYYDMQCNVQCAGQPAAAVPAVTPKTTPIPHRLTL